MIRFSLFALMIAILSAVLGFSATIYSNVVLAKSLIILSIASFSMSMVSGIIANQYKYQLNLYAHNSYKNNHRRKIAKK